MEGIRGNRKTGEHTTEYLVQWGGLGENDP